MWSQVAMKAISGVNVVASRKIVLISLCALSMSVWLVASLYQTVPVPLVSASAQYGAISGLPTNSNLCG